MKIAHIIAALSFTLSVTACQMTTDIGAYETGVFITQEKIHSLVVGRSTQNNVSDLVGHPMRKTQLGQSELWYYDYSKIRHIGNNVNESTVFEFNKQGILTKSYKTGTSKNTGNALADAANQ